MTEHIPWQNRSPLFISAIGVLLVIAALAFLSDRENDATQVKSGEDGNSATELSLAGGVQAPLKPVQQTELSRATELPTTIAAVDAIEIRIIDGGEETVLLTDASSVGEALRQAGIAVEAGDVITPDPDNLLEPDQEITIHRSIPVVIRVDGHVVYTRSHSLNVSDVLAQASITLEGHDYAFPGPDHRLRPGDTIQVTRVTEELRFEDVPIPFETMWQGVEDMELDQRAQISPGINGMSRRQFRLRYEDGILVGETYEGESIVQEPVNEVMGYGTKINVRVLETPEGPLEYWRVVKMRVTAYTAASSGKPPEHPAYGITASGLEAGTGIVAIDPKVVPFRSWVYVPGYGVGFAGDTGGGVKGRWIDLGYDEDEILAWSGYVDVFYLAPAPPPENVNYLIPSALP